MRLARRHDPHAGGQGRGGTAGIVIVVAVALLFEGDLPITVCERDEQARGG